MKYPAPAPVTVFRPDQTGSLQVSQIIEKPEFHRVDNGYENEIEVRRYRLIAIQETGEEMFAGYASTRPKALSKKYEWLNDHPEHRDVEIEEI